MCSSFSPLPPLTSLPNLIKSKPTVQILTPFSSSSTTSSSSSSSSSSSLRCSASPSTAMNASQTLKGSQSLGNSILDGASEENDGQKIIIKNKYGENLVGILHERNSKDLVILCHGFRSSKESGTISNLSNALVTADLSVFRFDFSGNGESEGSFEYGNYLKEVDDLRAVILHLSQRDYRVKAIAGHSKGGNVVLLYASVHRDINKVVNIAGRFDMNHGIERRLGKDFLQRIKESGFIDVKNKNGEFVYRVTEESLMERLRTNMHDACLLINENCKVLTVHGSEDEVIPVKDAYEISRLISNHKLCIVEGADHKFSRHPAELASALLEFL